MDISQLTFERQELKTYRLRDIYGSRELDAPRGYEFTGEFRVPEGNEPCLNSLRNIVASYGRQNLVRGNPRLILRAKPLPLHANPLQVTVEQIYGKPLVELKAPEGFKFKMKSTQTVEFRLIQQGDWYYTLPGDPCAIPYARPLGAPRLILERADT